MLNKMDHLVIQFSLSLTKLLNTFATDIDKIIIAKTILFGPIAGARDKSPHKQMVFSVTQFSPRQIAVTIKKLRDPLIDMVLEKNCSSLLLADVLQAIQYLFLAP